MSLPTISIGIVYDSEKGLKLLLEPHSRLISYPEIIADFLSNFKFTDKDFEGNFANIHLTDDDDMDNAERSPLKYISQLVRVQHHILRVFNDPLAKNREPRTTNAHRRIGGH